MKYVVGLILGIILAVGGVAVASNSQPDIEGAGNGGWINVRSGSLSNQNIKRVYDKDNNIVCWIFVKDEGYSSAGGISCVKTQ